MGLHSASVPGILCMDIQPIDTNKILTGGNDKNAVVFNKETEQVALFSVLTVLFMKNQTGGLNLDIKLLDAPTYLYKRVCPSVGPSDPSDRPSDPLGRPLDPSGRPLDPSGRH